MLSVFYQKALLILALMSTQDTAQSSGIREATQNCGPQCVKFLSRYFERAISLDQASLLCGFGKNSESVSMLAIKRACEQMGLYCFGVKGELGVINTPTFSKSAFVMPVDRKGYSHFIVLARAKQTGQWLMVDPSASSATVLSNKAIEKTGMQSLLAVSSEPFSVGPGLPSHSGWGRVFGWVSMGAIALALVLIRVIVRRRRCKRELTCEQSGHL